MPKFIEKRLRAEAAKQGKSGKAADRYVYGAMNNMGAMHGSKETAKGRAMEKKHEAAHGKPRDTESHMYDFRSRNNLKRGKA